MMPKIKSIFILLLFVWISLDSFSQGILNTQWVHRQASPLVNGNAEAWAIGTDSQGRIYWGVNQDMPGFFEFMTAMVFKMDQTENVIWEDTAAVGQYAQQSYNLKVSDSIIYLGGRTCRTFGTDSCDVLFFTTDANTGETGWEFTWDGGYGYEEIDGISLESDGIIITGWTKGPNGFEMQVLLMKIDYSGNIIWQQQFGGPGNRDDHQDGHIVVDDSMIYLSGLYLGSPLLGWDGLAMLAKFDKTNGNWVDSVTYGRMDPWTNAENALGMTSSGNYLYVTGYTTPSASNWDIFVAKFDKNMNQIWYRTWGGTGNAESARAIEVGPDNNLYVAGVTKSYGAGEEDMVLLKYDLNGGLQWYKTWGDSLDDHTLDMHIRSPYIYMTGKTNSFHPDGRWEAVLLQILLDNAAVAPEPRDLIGLSAKPNPLKNLTTLSFSNPLNLPHECKILNMQGKTVALYSDVRGTSLQVHRNGWASGLYLAIIQNEKGEAGFVKLVLD